MGLLDSILAGVAGNALGRSTGMGGMLGGRGGKSSVLMALLPVVLGMLANRRGGATGGAMPGSPGGTGSLGGMGGLGGLGGLLQRFQQNGLGDYAQYWVGTGENRPIDPDALSRVFDSNELHEIASQAGVSDNEARTGLSALLPQVVDSLTPQGQLPDEDQLLSSVDQFARELETRNP